MWVFDPPSLRFLTRTGCADVSAELQQLMTQGGRGVEGLNGGALRNRRRRRKNRRTKTGLLRRVLSEGDQAGTSLTHAQALLPGGWRP